MAESATKGSEQNPRSNNCLSSTADSGPAESFTNGMYTPLLATPPHRTLPAHFVEPLPFESPPAGTRAGSLWAEALTNSPEAIELEQIYRRHCPGQFV